MSGGGLEEAMTAQVLAAQTLKVAQETEKRLDQELQKLSNLDENDIESIRRRRIEEMKNRSAQEQKWRNLGHLSYTELRDEKEWFDMCKESERSVCHFYRGTTWRCQIVDRHMEALCKKHIETRFCKINAENCPFLAERLNIVLMPTIVMTKDNFSCDRIEGFDELGGRDDFTTEVLEHRLAKNGVIDVQDELNQQHLNKLTKKVQINKGVKSNPNKKAIYSGFSNRRANDSDDSEKEEDESY